MKNSTIMCIDLKSFYASVECVDRGLNPFTTPLVVADKSRGGGSIVLAVSPCLRAQGVPSRLRVYDLPKDKNIVFAMPRMKRYLEISARVVDILLDYVGEDDIHVYSIDESFIDLTPYMHLYKIPEEEIAAQIRARILNELGLTSTVGIGPNMLLAKLAMDIESKHTSSMIAKWTYDDVKTKLWPLSPLSKMWGIGANYERRLNALGIYTVGDLATYPKSLLIEKFGIMGGQLHDNANGIDESNIRDKYIPVDFSLSSGQVLFKDYSYLEVPTLIREMLDDLVLRMVYQQKTTRCVSLYIGYSKNERGGFSRQMLLETDTDDTDTIFEALMAIYNKFIENKPIRRICITLGKLAKVNYYQTSLFIDPVNQEKKRRLFYTIAAIKERYGKNAILRTSAKLPYSNIEVRHGFIGGHHG